MVRASLVSLSLTLAACGGASLSDFTGSQLSLEEQADGRVVVELSEARGGCASLSADVRATLNGQAMTLDFAGGEVGSPEGFTCRAPQFSLAASAVAGLRDAEVDARVVVDDGTTTLVLEARNVFAPRGLVPSRIDDAGEQKPGRTRLTFVWIPETDSDRSASWRLQGRTGQAQFGEARVESDRLSIELPESAADRATLRMDGRALAPITRCDGVAGCLARVRASSGDLAL